jgi:hypothetical protein
MPSSRRNSLSGTTKGAVSSVSASMWPESSPSKNHQPRNRSRTSGGASTVRKKDKKDNKPEMGSKHADREARTEEAEERHRHKKEEPQKKRKENGAKNRNDGGVCGAEVPKMRKTRKERETEKQQKRKESATSKSKRGDSDASVAPALISPSKNVSARSSSRRRSSTTGITHRSQDLQPKTKPPTLAAAPEKQQHQPHQPQPQAPQQQQQHGNGATTPLMTHRFLRSNTLLGRRWGMGSLSARHASTLSAAANTSTELSGRASHRAASFSTGSELAAAATGVSSAPSLGVVAEGARSADASAAATTATTATEAPASPFSAATATALQEGVSPFIGQVREMVSRGSTKLKLENHVITSSDAIQLSLMLGDASCSNIVEVSLNSYAIGDVGATAFARLLHSNTPLTRLAIFVGGQPDVERDDIGPQGAAALAAALCVNQVGCACSHLKQWHTATRCHVCVCVCVCVLLTRDVCGLLAHVICWRALFLVWRWCGEHCGYFVCAIQWIAGGERVKLLRCVLCSYRFVLPPPPHLPSSHLRLEIAHTRSCVQHHR